MFSRINFLSRISPEIVKSVTLEESSTISRSFHASASTFVKKSKDPKKPRESKKELKQLNFIRLKEEKIQDEKERLEKLRKLKDTPFLNSLLQKSEVFGAVDARYVKTETQSKDGADKDAEGVEQGIKPDFDSVFVGRLTPEETQLVLDNAPAASIGYKTRDKAILASPKQTQLAETQAEMARRVVSIKNQNSNSILDHNISLAIKFFERSVGDTASPEVQAAVFTVRINNLADHLRNNHKDHHNRRRYAQFLHKRASILRYLKRENLRRYFVCLKNLGLTQDMVEGQIPIPKRVE